MRRLVFLAALIPSVALATPQEGFYGNSRGAVLKVSGASDAGFDFTLVGGGTDGGNLCAEGDTACLQIDGHATTTAKGFAYIDPNDDHSRIFFAEKDGGLQVLSTIGDLGTGTENRPQKVNLPGLYTALAGTEGDASGAAALTADGAGDIAAGAGALHAFVSPTGNVSCLFDPGEPAQVRCDLAELNRSFTTPPDDCDLDWGDSFAIAATDTRGTLVCHGDTVADPDAAVLEYGSSLSFFGITCTSAKTGMTCTNAAGHGFAVARKLQSVF